MFGCTRPKPSQNSVPAGLTLASYFDFCFQCRQSFSLVLRRPIEITRLIGHNPPLSTPGEKSGFNCQAESEPQQCLEF
jgi:hypothetical protein